VGETEKAKRIENAWRGVREGKARTYDMRACRADALKKARKPIG